MIREKIIRYGFTQFHMNAEREEPWPVFPVLHHIWTPDSEQPHDHPHDITCWVQRGSYLEEVWEQRDGRLVRKETNYRGQGDLFTIKAETIHRISNVDDYWALCTYGPTRRDWRHYDVPSHAVAP